MNEKCIVSLSNGVDRALVNSKFQHLFLFVILNEIIKFPTYLQNSALKISASLVMSETQKRSFGPYSETWSD